MDWRRQRSAAGRDDRKRLRYWSGKRRYSFHTGRLCCCWESMQGDQAFLTSTDEGRRRRRRFSFLKNWRVCPVGLFSIRASSACSGYGYFSRGGEGRRDSIKNAGGDAPARYPSIVLTEGRSVFFAGGSLCQTAFFRLLKPPARFRAFGEAGRIKARQGRTGRLFFSRFPCGPAGGRLPPWRGCAFSCLRRRGPVA